MIAPSCPHERTKRHGRDRKGQQRWRCVLCGKTWVDAEPKILGDMRVPVDKAKLALRLLTEGMSIRATERTTGLHRDTICKLIVFYGEACQRFLDERMRNLTLTHLEFDEQWTYVAKKQARLTLEEREHCHDRGDVFLWTCADKETKLLVSFLVGKRSAVNAG